MRIIVTGGRGFIGTEIAKAHIANGDKVWVVDDVSGNNVCPVPRGVEHANLDLTVYDDQQAFGDLVKEVKPDVISHHAAKPTVMENHVDPVGGAEANVVATAVVLEVADTYDINRVLLASSGGSVFGDMKHRIMVDLDTLTTEPKSAYAASKVAMEAYGMAYREKIRKVVVLRYTNVYGSGCFGSVVQDWFERSWNGPQVFFLRDHGNMVRDFVFVKDVAKAHVKICNLDFDDTRDTYNVSSGCPTRIDELAYLVQKVTGIDADIEYADKIPGEVSFSCLKPVRLERLGWKPVDLEEGLQQAWDQFLEDRT